MGTIYTYTAICIILNSVKMDVRILNNPKIFKVCNFKKTKMSRFLKYNDINIKYSRVFWNITPYITVTLSQPFIYRQLNLQFVSILQLSKPEKCFRRVRSVTATFQHRQLSSNMNEGSIQPRGTRRFYVSPAICHFQINITSNVIMQNIITAKYLLWPRPTWIQNKMRNLGTLKS